MKKYLFAVACLLCAPFAYAEPGQTLFQGKNPTMYATEAIYKSSNTSVATSSMSVVLSSGTTLLKHVVVNTAGSSSVLELWAVKFSTIGFSKDEYRIAKIDTTAKFHFPYELYLTSGLAIYNYGSTPADITVTYWDFKVSK